METKRLTLRKLTTKDAVNLYKLTLNTDVIRFTGDVAFESIDEAKKYIELYDQYEKYGFGRWAVIEKETKSFLGWCGLRFSEETQECDLGFRLLKQHWNKGYATEAAKLCLDLAFTKYKMKEVIGRSHYMNKASHKVLKKIGMEYKGTIRVESVDWDIYYRINPHL
jgi:RimJ/RimL family protein N-acetyltransferase